MFIVEYLQADFWLPLEDTIMIGLTMFARSADHHMQLVSIDNSEYVEYIIGNEWTISFVIYCVSFFFFISALHATKVIDLRDMK